MARRVFFSFHFKPDNWRVSQVRNMGVVEGNTAVSDNDWETVTKAGDAAIEKWIAEQMSGRSCTVVLIGSETSGRKWIGHEIKKTWNDGKGLLGIYVHGLKNKDGNQASKGSNPFSNFTMDGKNMSSIVSTYDPPHTDSKDVYKYISDNIESWVEKAVKQRES